MSLPDAHPARPDGLPTSSRPPAASGTARVSQDPPSEHVLGVDVGGNHVKMGFVDPAGGIHNFQTFATKDFRESGDFIDRLCQTIAYKIIDYSLPVTRVGLGFPGTLSASRERTLEIPAIPELNGQPVKERLREALPTATTLRLENDANAAALGELIFAPVEGTPDSFAFVTLGTGVGSAYVLDGDIFIGGGNALELGHVPSRDNLKLEQNIGKQGILNLATRRLATFEGQTSISRTKPLSATELVVAASQGDLFARQIFYEVGELLGEGLVALIRILDVKTILIGGGLSAAYDFIRPGAEKTLYDYLSPYYLDALVLAKARLGNDAGLLGAASLVMPSTRAFN